DVAFKQAHSWKAMAALRFLRCARDDPRMHIAGVVQRRGIALVQPKARTGPRADDAWHRGGSHFYAVRGAEADRNVRLANYVCDFWRNGTGDCSTNRDAVFEK